MINESTGFNYNVSSPTSITSITIEIYCSYDTIAIKRVFLLLSLINAMNRIISIFKMAHNNSNTRRVLSHPRSILQKTLTVFKKYKNANVPHFMVVGRKRVAHPTRV
jgi:hypothetical protein